MKKKKNKTYFYPYCGHNKGFCLLIGKTCDKSVIQANNCQSFKQLHPVSKQPAYLLMEITQ